MSESHTPVQVKCIDHVTLIVKDLERSRQFYVDALGMEQVDRPGFGFEGSWFQAGETQIHLILEHEESTRAGATVSKPGVASRTHHFAFEVDDSHEAARRMAEFGYSPASGPKARPDGAVQVFIQDPDGHMVELCSPAANGSS